MNKEAKARNRLERILKRFIGVEERGDGYMAECPAHADANPSLSISQGDDGRVLLKCHAGCETEDVLREAGLSFKDIGPNGQLRIVATYDYVDEDGDLLFQVVRYEPSPNPDGTKTFKQRRPNGKGGWVWGTKGIPRVPYKLPAIIKAKKSIRVYITEGEKDADRLVDLGFVATTNAGGVKKWDPDFNQFLKGRPVVICPDNDPQGLEHAQRLADSLCGIAKSVKVLEFAGLGNKEDVSDWLDAGNTTADLRKLVEATDQWVPGRSTVNCQVSGPESIEVPAFPLDVFPKAIADFITKAADALSGPTDLVAVPMLAALGTAIGNTCRLQVKAGFIEGPRIYSAVIAKPGRKKSPALDYVTKPLHFIQKELQAEYQAAMDEYESARKEAAKNKDDNPEELKKPISKQVITTDATLESLAVLLNENPRGLLFEQDELTAWTRGMGQYKGGGGNDRQRWLSFWSGKTEIINRKGHPPIHVNNPFVCVTGCIQPEMLGELIDRQGREDGFIHRVLVTYPDYEPLPTYKTEDDYFKTEVDAKTMKAYAEVIRKLWGKRLDTFDFCQQTLTFNASGKRAWVDWINAHYSEMNAMTDADSLRGVWAKMDGYCARLSLIIHRCRYVTNETRSRNVDKESIIRAGRLVDYFKGHARRAYHQMKKEVGLSRLDNAIRWIQSNTEGTVTARQLLRSGLPGLRTNKDAKQLMTDLAEAGHGKTGTGKRKDQIQFTLA